MSTSKPKANEKPRAAPVASGASGYTKLSLQAMRLESGSLLVSNEWIARSAKAIARMSGAPPAPPSRPAKKGAGAVA